MGDFQPAFGVVGREKGQGVAKVADRRVPIGLGSLVLDVVDDAGDAGPLHHGTDVVEHRARQRAWHGHRHEGGQDTAQRRAHHHPVQVGDGQQVAQVIDVGGEPVAPPSGIILGPAPAPVIGAEHAALPAHPQGKAVKILAVAGQPGQAEYRRRR